MSTIIHLSNQYIKVVTGTRGEKKAEWKKYFTIEAPQGTLINGMVTDADTFGSFMKEFFISHKISDKDVYLVVSSTNFFAKQFELPNMSERKTFEYIRRELEIVDRNKNPMFSFVELKKAQKGKMRQLYVESADEEYILSFRELFSSIGIELKGIYCGLGSMIASVSKFSKRDKKTFLIQNVNVNHLTNILWVNGEYYYSNSSRLFHEKGSEEFSADLARSVSQIQQFMQANQVKEHLECIRLAGVEMSDCTSYQEYVNAQIDTIPVKIHDCPMEIKTDRQEEFHNYMYPLSVLIDNGRCSNFLYGYERKKKIEKLTGEKTIAAAIIGAAAIVMMIALGITAGIYFNKKSKLAALREYNGRADVIQQVEEYQKIYNENNFLSDQYDSIQSICDNIETYPLYNSDVNKTIDACAKGDVKIEMEGFDASDGVVSFSAAASNVKKTHLFIRNLKQQKIFEKVEYSGYSFNDDTGCWDIHVICTLTEKAGK